MTSSEAASFPRDRQALCGTKRGRLVGVAEVLRGLEVLTEHFDVDRSQLLVHTRPLSSFATPILASISATMARLLLSFFRL